MYHPSAAERTMDIDDSNLCIVSSLVFYVGRVDKRRHGQLQATSAQSCISCDLVLCQCSSGQLLLSKTSMKSQVCYHGNGSLCHSFIGVHALYWFQEYSMACQYCLNFVSVMIASALPVSFGPDLRGGLGLQPSPLAPCSGPHPLIYHTHSDADGTTANKYTHCRG